MDRREAVKAVAAIMGGAFSASSLSIMLDSCTSVDKQSNGNSYTDDEERIIERICDIIIPRTDTPGAVDAGTPAFVMMMMNECYTAEDQKKFNEGLTSFDKECKEKLGYPFLRLSPEKQEEAVKNLDADTLGKKNKKSDGEEFAFYRNLKALALLGFFTSEPGATKTLRYAQVPGHYEGCIPYHEGDKAWAS